MMKLWGSIACLVALTAGLSAQALDTTTPVAIVKLNKDTKVITQKTFRDQVIAVQSAMRKTALDAKEKAELLQKLVDEKLMTMDMDAKGIKVSDDDVYKELRTRNRGASMTDQQLRQAVETQTGQKWDEAVAGYKQQMAQQKYLTQFPQFQEIGKVTVDAKEIQEYYDSHSDQFTSPDYIRISHIFFDTKNKPNGTPAEIQKRAEDVLKKITSGQSTFEEQASMSSEDTMASKVNGDLGYLPKTAEMPRAQQFISIFGREFFESVFKLKKGEVSAVLVSNVGLHIVRVTQKGDKLDHHFLGIDEAVEPGSATTVRMYIQQGIMNTKQQAALNKLVTEIATDLKKKAEIKTFEQNL